MIAAEGLPVEVACRVLSVSVSGYYASRDRAPSERTVRHTWLTDLIAQIHMASRSTYGMRRVHAELTLGRGVAGGRQSVERLMRRARLRGLAGRPRYAARRVSPPRRAACSGSPLGPAETRYGSPTSRNTPREGKRYRTVVLDAFRRRVVCWSIDADPTATLVTTALGVAVEQRRPAEGGTVIHRDQGTQFTSWSFTQRSIDSGLLPSTGSEGDLYDNAMIESFWSRMQVELPDRKRWKMWRELVNASFEHLDIFQNRQRRHSALGMMSPFECEGRDESRTAA